MEQDNRKSELFQDKTTEEVISDLIKILLTGGVMAILLSFLSVEKNPEKISQKLKDMGLSS
jgi:hypothetical protein